MNGKLYVFREFWNFLKEQKKFWLLPMVVILLLFGLLLVFAQGSALAPFIYTLF
jgi:drug/metabolite transporter superfamily protein YnfA